MFVDRLVVVVRQIVSTKTRKHQNTWNERSERMSTQTAETVKDVRVLLSFYAAREASSKARSSFILSSNSVIFFFIIQLLWFFAHARALSLVKTGPDEGVTLCRKLISLKQQKTSLAHTIILTED